MTPPNGDITTDTALRLLGSQQRRKVLRHLIEADGHVPLDRLVEVLVAGAFPSTDGEAARDHVALTLHHADLPMLQEAGVVEFDPRRETVRYHPTDRVEEVLEMC